MEFDEFSLIYSYTILNLHTCIYDWNINVLITYIIYKSYSMVTGTIYSAMKLYNFVLSIYKTGWTGKDGSPSPTLGTIIKKSYYGSSVLSTSLGSKTLNNTSSLGLEGTKILRPSCRRPPARTFHTPVGTLGLDAPALVWVRSLMAINWDEVN